MLGIDRHNFPPNFVSLDEAVTEVNKYQKSDIGYRYRYRIYL